MIEPNRYNNEELLKKQKPKMNPFYRELLGIFSDKEKIKKGKETGKSIVEIAEKMGLEIQNTAACREKIQRIQARISQFRRFCLKNIGEWFDCMKFDSSELSIYFFANSSEEFMAFHTKTCKRKEKFEKRYRLEKQVLAKQLENTKNVEERKILLKLLR